MGTPYTDEVLSRMLCEERGIPYPERDKAREFTRSFGGKPKRPVLFIGTHKDFQRYARDNPSWSVFFAGKIGRLVGFDPNTPVVVADHTARDYGELIDYARARYKHVINHIAM